MKKYLTKILEVQGNENVIIPSKIFDIYTRLEISLGLYLSAQSNILTEARSILDEL